MWRKPILMIVALLSLAVIVTPAAAQSSVVWDGHYYNSADLTGGEVFSRRDQAISFNWGNGSPDSRIDSESFSVRWGTDVYLPAGTYRFSALADDNVRVIVDFQLNPLINTWGQGKAGQMVTADITLNDGVHHIQVDYGEISGNAFAFVNFVNVNQAPSPQQPPIFQPPVEIPVTPGNWTAQYFANTGLFGSPTLIQSEAIVTHNWNAGSPTQSIPSDNWSARWSSTQFMNAGTYQITARADDGVRVFIDGIAVINEWHASSGQTYTANVNLTQGPHNFLIEYYEAGGVAFIELGIAQLNVQQPTPVFPTFPPTTVPPTSGFTATVTSSRLNVRSEPNPVSGRIVAIISRGDTYSVLETLPNGTWVQLNVNGVIGWVNSAYVRFNRAVSAPPPSQVPGATGFFVTARPSAVTIRSGPGLQYGRIAALHVNQSAPVLGRNTDSSWWLISYNGVRGWVSSAFAIIQSNANVGQIPITG